MKKRSTVGLVLILAGVVWFINLTDFIHVNWYVAAKTLWPLVLIAIGISLVAGRYKFVTMLVWVLTFAVFIGYGIIHGNRKELKSRQEFFEIKSAETEKIPAEDKIVLDSETLEGKLIIDLDIARINIEDGNSNLLAKLDTNIPNLEQQHIGGKQTVLKYIHHNKEKSNAASNFNLQISHAIPWEMETTFSVVDGKLNFSRIPVKKLALKLEVGDLDLVIGNKQEHTVIEIQAGAADLDIYIPENVGLMVNSGKLFSNISFHNIKMTNQDNIYISDNYENALHKIEMHIQSALSTIEIFAE